MLTLVPGLTEARSRALNQNGFSLLETLIVLAIIGIITGTVGLSLRAVQAERDLQTEARRLAHLFELAQAEARKTGRTVRWEYGETGYRFTQTSPLLTLPVALAERLPPPPRPLSEGNGALRPRSWGIGGPVEVRVEPAGSPMFEGEWVSGPRRVELSDGLHTVVLQRAGNGQYRVSP